jgi:uncharacterized protein YjbI with pentapeptide repeats
MDLCNFADATVVQINFANTEFSGALFTNAILVASTFPSCQLDPMAEPPYSAPSVENANIYGTQFADVSGGVITNPANMDGLDMEGAQYSTVPGTYEPTNYTDYYGKPVFIYASYGPTVLGATTSSTTCPNGQLGPCTLP